MCDNSSHQAFELSVLGGTVPGAQIRRGPFVSASARFTWTVRSGTLVASWQ